MNPYRKAWDQYSPPDGLEERLRTRVLSEPVPKHPRMFRPGIRRKVTAFALAAALLTITGAAFVLPWDPFFFQRYGLPNLLAENAYQKVNVTAVCDDVTVTLREVIGDASSLSYILDYQLPADTPSEVLARVEENDGAYPNVNPLYLLHGDITWEEYAARDAEKWAALDWLDYSAVCDYWTGNANYLYDRGRMPHSSNESGSRRYDPETRTITYFYRYTVQDKDVDFTAQPLTIVFPPPVVKSYEDSDSGPDVVLVDHPVLITFQPDYQTTERCGTLQSEDGLTIYVKVTSTTFSIQYDGPVSDSPYTDIETLTADIFLIDENGTETPLPRAAASHGGSTFGGPGSNTISITTSAEFPLLTDTSEITAVRVGEYTIPLENA